MPFMNNYFEMYSKKEKQIVKVYSITPIDKNESRATIFVPSSFNVNNQNGWKTVNRDKQKREWCKKLNIPLYEIKYTDDIEKMLEGIIKDSADAPDMEEAEEIIKENNEDVEN